MSDRGPRGAFAEVMAGMAPGDPHRCAVAAGLSVMGLVDTWLSEGGARSPGRATGIAESRRALESVSALSAARQILAGIVEAIDGSATASLTALAPRLLAYGRSLEYDAWWSLAADVYATIIARGAAEADPLVLFDAHMRTGYCHRRAGDLDAADAAYAAAQRVATAAGDRVRALHSQVGHGAVALERGNLPLAESTLDAVIAATDGEECTDVRAMALHDRSTVAYHRGQNDDAVRLAYAALRLTHSLTARDRILNDLGAYFVRMGALDAARDSFMVLSATAQEQHLRWLAMINLLEVSAFQTNEPIFEETRRGLIGERMPPVLEAQYHYYTAVGYHAFGRLDAGLDSLSRARQLAEAHGANQLLFQVEELTALITRGAAAAARAQREMPAELAEVIDAVSEMRALAGV